MEKIKQQIKETKQQIKEKRTAQETGLMNNDVVMICKFGQEIIYKIGYLSGLSTSLTFLEEDNGK